jgi:hypothetical protein
MHSKMQHWSTRTSNDHFYGQSQCRHGQSTSAAERDWFV